MLDFKVIFLIVVTVTLAAHQLGHAVDDDEAWEDYKTKFSKTYATQEEEQLRKKVFIDNKLYIESHNVKENVQRSFIQGINHLSDLTQDEINNSRNGFRLNLSETSHHHTDGLLENLLLAINSSLLEGGASTERGLLDNLLAPRKLDYRNKGRVSKVKDQGSCGSCWSFATTGALESILAARNRTVLLSEQNLVDCSRRYGNYGCNGGLMDAALRYVRDHGIMAAKDYEYTGKDGTCKFVRSKSVTSVRGSTTLPRGNEGLLRLVLYLTGPIPIAIDASARPFHSYKSGIYDDRSCHSSPNSLNHAVLLVGYGSEGGRDYWIIKNSWGTKWGDNGYIKMARNHNNLCGIATYAVVPLP